MHYISSKKYLILLCGLQFAASFGLLNGSSVSSVVDNPFVLNSVYYKVYAINITRISPETRAIELQAISQGGLVLTSLRSDFSEDETTKGSSAGVVTLLQSNHTTSVLFYLKVFPSGNCSTNYSEQIFVTATSLNGKQPIPGGCNLVHSANYYPLISTNSNNSLIEVTFSPANVGYPFSGEEPACDIPYSANQQLIYNVYVHFLVYSYQKKSCINCELSSSCNKKACSGYFSQELTEILANEAKNVGTNIKTLHYKDKPKFTLPLLPCSSVVIFMDVVDPVLNISSKYVPAIVFNDNRLHNQKYTIFVKVCLVFLIAIGSILCFSGHRYFLFELFTFGGITFGLLSCIIIIACDPSSAILSVSSKWVIISVSALLGGFLFGGIWWRFDCHIIFSQLICLVGGFLLASVIFITPFGNLSLFWNGMAFAGIVVIVIVLYNLLLCGVSPALMCAITSSFVGSYMIVASLGCGVFMCSMMSQIMELMLLKIANKHFIRIIVVVPLQTSDYVLIGGWTLLFVGGCVVQFFLLRSRPQFPESPFKARRTQSALSSSPPAISSATEEPTSASSDSSSTSLQSSCTSAYYDGDVSDDVIDEDLGFDSVSVDDTAQLLSVNDV